MDGSRYAGANEAAPAACGTSATPRFVSCFETRVLRHRYATAAETFTLSRSATDISNDGGSSRCWCLHFVQVTASVVLKTACWYTCGTLASLPFDMKNCGATAPRNILSLPHSSNPLSCLGKLSLSALSDRRSLLLIHLRTARQVMEMTHEKTSSSPRKAFEQS